MFVCLNSYLNVVNSHSLFLPVSHNYLTHPDFSVYLPAVYFLSEKLVGIQDNIKIKIVDANFRKETFPNPVASFLPHQYTLLVDETKLFNHLFASKLIFSAWISGIIRIRLKTLFCCYYHNMPFDVFQVCQSK